MARKDNPPGTDNVLQDLGFDDAEELSAKAALAFKLNELIDQRELSQMEAAAIIGMTQLLARARPLLGGALLCDWVLLRDYLVPGPEWNSFSKRFSDKGVTIFAKVYTTKNTTKLTALF
ncbi:hypothetical protein GCM10027093_11370 [Paraburkholderia jirisanensis]